MLACPVCNSPLKHANKHNSGIYCTNKDCVAYSDPYPIVDGIPILIFPELEFSILDTLDQFVDPKDKITGYHDRDTSRRKLRFRQIIQDIFYNFSQFEFIRYDKLLSMLHSSARVLIVGGGNIDTRKDSSLSWVQHFRKKNIEFTVTDIYLSENVHLVCDAHYLAFLDASFDAVIITTVLEHVLSPTVVVSEIYRVLKPNGLLYATVPYMQCVHEGAYDFTRFTLSGQRWLFRYFIEHDSGYFVGVCCSYLYNFTTFISLILKFKPLGILIRLMFWRFFASVDRLLPSVAHLNQGMCNYFVGAKSEIQAIKAGEIPGYYKNLSH